MHIEMTPFKCSACGHEYMQETLQNVFSTVWIMYMKCLRCPNCGSGWRHLGIRLRPEEPQGTWPTPREHE